MNKILIIRLSSLGDIVLCSPVLRSLRNKYPQASIHFVCKPQFVAMVGSYTYVDKVIAYKDEKSFYSDLKSENYDRIIDLHKNFRSLKIKNALKTPAISFSKDNLRKWIAVKTKWDVLRPLHLVDRYFESLGTLGLTYDEEGLEFKSTAPSADLPNNYVCLSLGATHFTKRISKSLAQTIIQCLDRKIVIVGGDDVKEIADFLASLHADHIINLVGKTSIFESASIIEKSDFMITGDTGMMHIGAALGTKMIVIWGNTVPEFGMYPLYKNRDRKWIDIQKDLSCRPCSKIGFASCPKGHHNCIESIGKIDVQSALEAIAKI